MADNPLLGLGNAMLGADYAQQRDQTATAIMARQREAEYQLYRLAMQQRMMAMNPYFVGVEREPEFQVEGGDGIPFVALYTCPVTEDKFALSSPEKPAVERGMRHYTQKWRSALNNLKSAGLQDSELMVALVLIKPRLAAEADKERKLEEGGRQGERKARELLVMCLTPEQKAEFEKDNSFTLAVDHALPDFPKGAFRIRKASSFNVEHVESKETFCVVAQEKVPVYDQMLMQKLLLEQEPERFFKTANRSGRSGLFWWGFDEAQYNTLFERYHREVERTREPLAQAAIAPPRRSEDDGWVGALDRGIRRFLPPA